MIPVENEYGVIKITLLLGLLYEVTNAVIHEAKRVQFSIGAETGVFQCLVIIVHQFKTMIIFRNGIGSMVTGCLDDREERFVLLT